MVSLGKNRNKHARQAAEGLDSDTCTAARSLSSLSGRTFPGVLSRPTADAKLGCKIRMRVEFEFRTSLNCRTYTVPCTFEL